MGGGECGPQSFSSIMRGSLLEMQIGGVPHAQGGGVSVFSRVLQLVPIKTEKLNHRGS